MCETFDELKLFMADRIGKLAERNNMSDRELSLALGYGESYINNIVNSVNTVSMEGIYYINKYFKSELYYFFDDRIEAPEIFNEYVEESKKLDRKNLEIMLELVKALSKA